MLVAAVLFIVIGSISKATKDPTLPPPPRKEKAVDDFGRDYAVKALKQEPGVVEVLWENASLWVSVPDDGTDRTPLAVHFCEVIRRHTKDAAVITIKDPTATVDLGKYMCSKPSGQ